jgi:hypothetical protein
VVKPIRALLLLVQAISADDGALHDISLDELGNELEVPGCSDAPDLEYKHNLTDKLPAFAIELKVEERSTSSTQWLHQTYDYATSQPEFSKRPEHRNLYTVDPETTIASVKSSRTPSGRTYVPSPGTPLPSRQLGTDPLHLLALQVRVKAVFCNQMSG